MNGRGGRPRKPDDEKLGVQIALRMDSALVARLDEHMERLRQREPAVVWSRGSAIRSLMLQALAVAENLEVSSSPSNGSGNGGEASTSWERLGTPTSPRLRSEQVLSVVRDLEGPNRRQVHTAEVRERIPDMERAPLDAALLMLEQRGFVELTPPTEPPDGRERSSAVVDPFRGCLSWVRTKAAPPPTYPTLTTKRAR
jgi:hypothetical protein